MLELAHRAGRVDVAELLQRVVLQLGIDADHVGLVVGEVAQHALREAQVLVQQGAGGRCEATLADRGPGLAQVGDVVGQLGIARVFGIRAQDGPDEAALHEVPQMVLAQLTVTRQKIPHRVVLSLERVGRRHANQPAELFLADDLNL